MAVFVRLDGLTAYEDGHRLQQEVLAARIAGALPDVVLLLEHQPVITLGRKRDAAASVLDAGDVPVVSVERGGDATWHGPGQLVAYPILRLEGRRADLHLHLHSLEDAVSDVLTDLGLAPTRDPRNTGVWLPAPAGTPQKVCSIGIACRRWVTWHGLALNIAPDMRDGFGRINPCGFDSEVMTRLVDHLDPCPTLDALVTPLSQALSQRLEVPHERALTLEEPTLQALVAAL